MGGYYIRNAAADWTQRKSKSFEKTYERARPKAWAPWLWSPRRSWPEVRALSRTSCRSTLENLSPSTLRETPISPSGNAFCGFYNLMRQELPNPKMLAMLLQDTSVLTVARRRVTRQRSFWRHAKGNR